MNKTQREIQAVESFMARVACADQSKELGNLTIHFMGKPRMFTIRVAGGDGQEVSGTGPNLITAMEALIESMRQAGWNRKK